MQFQFDVRERVRCVRDVVDKPHLAFVDFSPHNGVHKRSCIARSLSRPRVPYIVPFNNSRHWSDVHNQERASTVNCTIRYGARYGTAPSTANALYSSVVQHSTVMHGSLRDIYTLLHVTL
jgi:hypothetical protein